MYNLTKQWQAAHAHFESLLQRKLDNIARLAGVDRSQLIPINPCNFLDHSSDLIIEGDAFGKIVDFIEKNKRDDTFLISPMDADVETANQISYKTANIDRKIRASKCKAVPIPSCIALDFFVRNHRQSPPTISSDGVSFALVLEGETVAVMTYDLKKDAVRGKGKEGKFELLRLSIQHGVSVMGGASKLQKICEESLRGLGISQIFSYSNATINNGRVYEALGFTGGRVTAGRVFVIKTDFSLEGLAACSAKGIATLDELHKRGYLRASIGGNRLWTKDI